MFQLQISHSKDLKRLRDEGFDIEVCDGHLFVHHIPYINNERQVKIGVLVSVLDLSGDRTTKPNHHMMMFSGEQPCDEKGNIIKGIYHSKTSRNFSNDIRVAHTFSNKPKGGYSDYYEKVKNYANIISAPAKYLDNSVTEKPFNPIIKREENSIFKYYDTNSSRANIESLNKRFSKLKIAIIGLGGTGAYILDLVAKTHVSEIHIYDGDVFLNHNAFRSPGAASLESLNEKPNKTGYYKSVYESMRSNIHEHPYYIDKGSFDELKEMDYVFISIDNNKTREELVDYLYKHDISFIDVGLGVTLVDDSLIGTIRVTTVTSKKNNHINTRIPFGDTSNNEYSTNIQIAELNSLNAVLAVIKWKKLVGFYHDLIQEHHSSYTINDSYLNNEEEISI